MRLEYESGKIIENPTEADVRDRLRGERFAVLKARPGTYLQCAEQNDEPFEYLLEYQEEDTDHHYHAVEEPLPLEQVLAVFCKYLCGDESWKTDIRWEKMTL